MAVEITWLGRNCFRIKGRDGVVITDPCPPDSGYKIAKQAADVLTISRKDDPGYSYREAIGAEALVLDAPGEYETGGILVTGIARQRPDGSRNIMFVYELDGIRIGHLGVPVAPGGMEELKDLDILLIPVGGGNSLAAAAAADIMTTIDPKVAIPMNYRTDVETMELDALDSFLKETGSKPEPQPRLQLTRSQLPSNLTVVVLEPK
jgi:L-ascorbate metabolism protein UlaG (beta-lactamase superfamily)